AHVAEEYILADQLIAPSAVNKSEQEIMDSSGNLRRDISRGFLTPLCATLSNMRATLVVLGTSLSLSNADHVYTAISKPENFLRIVKFPSVNEDLVEETLKRTLDLEGCVVDSVKRRKLTGRVRFPFTVISEVSKLGDSITSTNSKQEALDRAMDRAITWSKE